MGFAGYSSDIDFFADCVFNFYTMDILGHGWNICGYVSGDGDKVCGSGEKF